MEPDRALRSGVSAGGNLMANHTRVRADLPAWATGTAVSNAEFEKFDANLVKCPNFAEGCSMSPTAAINLGGTYGMIFSATTPCILNGNTAIGATPSNTLSVSATSTFSGNVTCTGNVTVNGNTIIGNAVGDTLVVNATPTFVAAVGCSSTLSVSSTISAGGTVSCPTVSTGTVNTTALSATGTVALTGDSTTIGDSSADALTVVATASFQNGVTLGSSSADAITVNGALTANAGAVLGTDETNILEYNGILVPGSSTGSLRLRYSAVTLSSNGTFSSDGAQFLRIESLNGAARTLTSLATRNLHSFKNISNEDATYTLTLLNYDTSLICYVAPRIGVLLVSDGTLWHPVNSGALLI
jgi:cytoskeletal protein CcmA (bactofilin family)